MDADILFLHFRKELKRLLGPFSTDLIREFLSEQPLHNSYKKRKKNIVRRPVHTFEALNTLQCDLYDVQNFKQFNQGVSFVLVCVDPMSKYVI